MPLLKQPWNSYIWTDFPAEPHCSVSTIADLRTGGRWFDSQVGRYSLRGLMTVIATGFIPLSPLSVVSTMVMWESSKWLGKNIVQYCPGKDGWCTGYRDVTEIPTVENGIKHHTTNQLLFQLEKLQLIKSALLELRSLSTEGSENNVEKCFQLFYTNLFFFSNKFNLPSANDPNVSKSNPFLVLQSVKIIIFLIVLLDQFFCHWS